MGNDGVFLQFRLPPNVQLATVSDFVREFYERKGARFALDSVSSESLSLKHDARIGVALRVDDGWVTLADSEIAWANLKLQQALAERFSAAVFWVNDSERDACLHYSRVGPPQPISGAPIHDDVPRWDRAVRKPEGWTFVAFKQVPETAYEARDPEIPRCDLTCAACDEEFRWSIGSGSYEDLVHQRIFVAPEERQPPKWKRLRDAGVDRRALISVRCPSCFEIVLVEGSVDIDLITSVRPLAESAPRDGFDLEWILQPQTEGSRYDQEWIEQHCIDRRDAETVRELIIDAPSEKDRSEVLRLCLSSELGALSNLVLARFVTAAGRAALEQGASLNAQQLCRVLEASARRNDGTFELARAQLAHPDMGSAKVLCGIVARKVRDEAPAVADKLEALARG